MLRYSRDSCRIFTDIIDIQEREGSSTSPPTESSDHLRQHWSISFEGRHTFYDA